MFKQFDANEILNESVDLLSALADETRQKIIISLKNHASFSVNEIADKFELSRPTISHHLLLMKRAGLLVSEKKGKEVLYSFNKEQVVGRLELILNFIKDCC
jgi:DNA-binding transcriptional ArsR family regulator